MACFESDVAALLKLAEQIVYAMDTPGDIPAFNFLRQWRIERAELDKGSDAQPRVGGGKRDGD